MSKYSTSTDDVEAQSPVPVPLPFAVAAASSAPAAASGYDDEAGKGIGMAMFFCIVLGSALGWIPLFGALIGASICLIAAIVLASTITCGCCGGSNLNLNPKVKRWSTAALICLVLQLLLFLIAFFIGFAGAIVINDGYVYVGADVVMALNVVSGILFFLAAVFAGIFTWGRKSCGNA